MPLQRRDRVAADYVLRARPCKLSCRSIRVTRASRVRCGALGPPESTVYMIVSGLCLKLASGSLLFLFSRSALTSRYLWIAYHQASASLQDHAPSASGYLAPGPGRLRRLCFRTPRRFRNERQSSVSTTDCLWRQLQRFRYASGEMYGTPTASPDEFSHVTGKGASAASNGTWPANPAYYGHRFS